MENMEIYLLKNGEETLLDNKKTFKECMKYILNKINEYKYVSYYNRFQMIKDDVVMIDFGSWSDFFLIKGITFNEIMKAQKEEELDV